MLATNMLSKGGFLAVVTGYTTPQFLSEVNAFLNENTTVLDLINRNDFVKKAELIRPDWNGYEFFKPKNDEEFNGLMDSLPGN